MKLKSDRIVTHDGIVDGFVYISDGKIVEVSTEDKEYGTSYDFTGLYIAPGFIETHTHGAGGYGFINSSIEDVIDGCNFELKNGTTTIAPTVTTDSFSNMAKAVENIAFVKRNHKADNNVLGAHLEGPYLSPNQCGAQFPSSITEPKKEEYESLIKKYGDSICRWTYAPERDKNGEFCKYLKDHHIIASAGHTDARYEDMVIAIENGCNLITHLYSCTSTIKREGGFRTLGVIESTFLRDELYAEMIADGKHLPSELMKMIIKIKGIDKVIATTDSLSLAGTNIKEGNLSGTEFIVEDGVCKLKDRSAFAGSIATQNMLLKNLISLCDLNMTDAIKPLTENVARVFGLNKGIIKDGYDADIIVFDDEINIMHAFVLGQKKF